MTATDAEGASMARQQKARSGKKNGNGANLGFEEKLWQAADKLRGSLDAAEYKGVVLGLIFLKYISDAFEERWAMLDRLCDDPKSDYHVKTAKQKTATLEDRDEYLSANVFWVPEEARWSTLQAAAKKPTIGKLIDDAMDAIERENPRLKAVLPKRYARPDLDKTRLGQLIDLIGTITVGDAASRSKDILGRVYEYFLGKFAAAEGKLGGEFFTPRCVVRLLVEMLEPYKGRVFDPCCGSGGMFVSSEKFVEAHGGKIGDISIYGQESNPTTWRLCQMNLAIRGIEVNLGSKWADSFREDLHPDVKTDFLLANPPFNVSDWNGEMLREDKRWEYGVPPVGNANYAWIQHFIHHLSPTGTAGFVMANGSLSSNQSGEGEIRKAIIEADLADCIVAMPGQLFYTTPIPVCLWFLSRNKANGRFRNRKGETLFIDARKLGTLVDRIHQELSDEEIARIAETYHKWRSKSGKGYEDVAGFCKSGKTDEIRQHGHVLTPGRYVGAEEVEDDGEPFEEKMKRLIATLDDQFKESGRLEQRIRRDLSEVGFNA
jgi:type I restriction enzyme M protein